MSIATTYQGSHSEYVVTYQLNVMVPMRDGVCLVTGIDSANQQRITLRIYCDNPNGN